MIDLKEILDERSAVPSDVLGHLRLGQVRQRIQARRKRRIGITAGLVVLGLVLSGYPMLRLLSPEHRGQTAADLPAKPKELPDYLGGARVVAGVRLDLARQKSAETWWQPSDPGLVLVTRCRVPRSSAVVLRFEIDGKPVSRELTCGNSDMRALPVAVPQDWLAAGLRVGAVSRVKVTATELRTLDQATGKTTLGLPVPDTGEVLVGLAERVAFTDYPLPKAPATLGPVSLMQNFSFNNSGIPARSVHLRSVPGKPLQPVSATLTWPEVWAFAAQSRTPGALKITVNGAEGYAFEWWSYAADDLILWPSTPQTDELEAPGLATVPSPGEQVTITVTPEHVTGDWQVDLSYP